MKILDTKTIIINIMAVDKKMYLSVKRLQKLFMFIYNELSRRSTIANYEIVFDIGIDSIERTVLCNSRILDFDIDGDLIYLRDRNIDRLVEQYALDENIKEIITDFAMRNALL